MYLEEKVDLIFSRQELWINLMTLFLPKLENESGVIHFLEITKNTFNNYIKKLVFVEGIHFVVEGGDRRFIPDEIIKLKAGGVKGKRKVSNKQNQLDAINLRLGIIPAYSGI